LTDEIDLSKMGEAMARTMDRIDLMVKSGEITSGYVIDNVLVVAGFVKPATPDDPITPDAVDLLIVVDGTTQVPYVQHGLLQYGIDTAGSLTPEDDD
jgi:hypothetical protein